MERGLLPASAYSAIVAAVKRELKGKARSLARQGVTVTGVEAAPASAERHSPVVIIYLKHASVEGERRLDYDVSDGQEGLLSPGDAAMSAWLWVFEDGRYPRVIARLPRSNRD